MTDKTMVKVGDVVAWDEVPSGAMVRDSDGDLAMRIGDDGSWVMESGFGTRVYGWRPDFSWSDVYFEEEERLVVIATMLTGYESGLELQGMVERFDREHPAT